MDSSTVVAEAAHIAPARCKEIPATTADPAAIMPLIPAAATAVAITPVTPAAIITTAPSVITAIPRVLRFTTRATGHIT